MNARINASSPTLRAAQRCQWNSSGLSWKGCYLPVHGAARAANEATRAVPYFNYVGKLGVSGVVGPVSSSGTTQTFYYSLNGVDPACTSGRDESIKNSCGIHIHTGTTCVADALGHYYDTSLDGGDPWANVAYTSVSGSTRGSYTVTTGLTGAQVVGHAMVIHDKAGARIACAPVSPVVTV